MTSADLTASVDTAELRSCLRGGWPIVQYQPVVHLETGLVVGAEAFSQFPDTAPTLAWFAAAEAAGLGTELETRIVLNILGSRPRWPKRWEMVGVNVSPERITDERIRKLLTEVGESTLVVELTDQTALPSDMILKDRLEDLRSEGVRIAVSGVEPTDAGYERTLRIQPEVVKLDVRAVPDGNADAPDLQRLSELVTRCQRSGIFVVAVGVETKRQLEQVEALGIDAVQGHLFGRPMDLDDAIEMSSASLPALSIAF